MGIALGMTLVMLDDTALEISTVPMALPYIKFQTIENSELTYTRFTNSNAPLPCHFLPALKSFQRDQACT